MLAVKAPLQRGAAPDCVTLPSRAVPRGLTYADLGGIDSVLEDIMELIVCPLKHPEVQIPRRNTIY